MFSTCANPDCATPFDYHRGEFFRFHNDHMDEAHGHEVALRAAFLAMRLLLREVHFALRKTQRRSH